MTTSIGDSKQELPKVIFEKGLKSTPFTQD